MSTQAPRSGWLEVALVGALLLLANAALWYGLEMNRTSGGSSPEQVREVASRLASAGVTGEAARYYARYLEQADVPAVTRAQVGLATARLLKEEGRLEEALGFLYQVEVWAPTSPAAKEAAPLIVEVLERLGHGQAAQTALSSRSRLTPKAPDKVEGGPVVARINGEPVTTADLDRAIDALPPAMQASAKDPAQKKQFLTQYVAEELLYRKGLKRGLDKDPVVRRQIDGMNRQVIIGRLLEEELRDKVRVDEGDLRTFYQANIQRFTGPDGKQAPFEQVKEQVQQAYMMSKVQALSQELLAQAQAAEEVVLFPEVLGTSGSSPSASPPMSPPAKPGSSPPASPGGTP